jgi:Pyruvate/2-oxoacid:ferredoxin oxidoreductase delta subunit
MCEFCTRHGDGEKWYLNAQNYAFDLSSDLERRGYVVDFATTFDERMPKNLKRLEQLGSLPAPVAQRVRHMISERQKKHHWGQPLPIEDCERVFDLATSIVQIPCVCRRFAGTPEKGYCLLVAVQPMDDVLMEAFPEYAEGPDVAGFQELSKAEALALLRRTEEEGMMHSVWTFMTPFIAGLCNCDLASGCLAMRSTLEFDTKVMWKGEYVAKVDPDLCTGCRACVALCPFGAIAHDLNAHKALVDATACYGCGTCRAACSQDAITLTDRALVPSVDW